jgi:uncharacterized protein (DUF1800 family)
MASIPDVGVRRMRSAYSVSAALVLCTVAVSLQAQQKAIAIHAASSAPSTHTKLQKAPLAEQERALQILNRFTFGPRPGDLNAVMQSGTDAWFERQLNPASIPDPVLDRRLAEYPALQLTAPQLVEEFPTNQVVRQIVDGKRPMPNDPTLAAVYEVLVAKQHRKQKEDQATQAVAAAPAATMSVDNQMMAVQNEQKKRDPEAARGIAEQLLVRPREQRMAAILTLPLDQRIVLTASVPEPQKSQLTNDFTPRERELFAEMAGGPDAAHVVAGELQQAKILRAILSERQLQEVMTDFWFNHFNVFLNKNEDQVYTPGYERDAIRTHALGKFSDLLLATAQHPAMLVYLDNWQSVGPDSIAGQRPRPNAKQPQRGLNENYGREVMELHTVGVNGGYSQADVTNLSKILTGWTIDQPQQGGGFVFEPRRHEPGSKKWFGQTIKENGFAEGQQALLWLAAQPQTAHFISYKLAQRFVADEPPPSLVDRMAHTFLESQGDIRQVLLTMVRSPEFWSPKQYRAKVKTPLEFVASALRATDTNPTNPGALVGTLRNMGEPLYQMLPPTGYPMTADHWMNSGALVDRLNFSLALANNKLGNTKFDATRLLAEGLLSRSPEARPVRGGATRIAMSETAAAAAPGGEDEALNLMETMLVGDQVSERTNNVIRKQLTGDEQTQPHADPAQTLDTMTALILGSPEFQMH